MHNIQLLGMLPGDDEVVDLVDSVYGPVQKGSMLSYQQRRPLVPDSTDDVDAPFYPDFLLPMLHNTHAHIPHYKKIPFKYH